MDRIHDLRVPSWRLEEMKPCELADLFPAYLCKKPVPVPYADLAEAWGYLFSALYLSAEELVGDPGTCAGPFCGVAKETFATFIREDCRNNGGAFVIQVIQKGPPPPCRGLRPVGAAGVHPAGGQGPLGIL